MTISKTIDSVEYWEGGSDYLTKETKYFYFIRFSFPDGNSKKFEISKRQYQPIDNNDTGTLTYKEKGAHTLFIDFQRTG